MTVRFFSPLLAVALVTLSASSVIAAPDSAPAPAATPAPVSASPAPWMQGTPPPPAWGLYPGWRLEETEDARTRTSENGKRTWYGWQSLAALVPSHLVFATGFVTAFATRNTELGVGMIILGMGGHVLASPITHWLHGNTGRGFLSLGLNVGLPVLGSVIADASDTGELTVPLALLSVIGWPVVDIVVLSYEDPPEPQRTSMLGIRSLGVVPMIDGYKKGLSLVGQF